MERHGDPRFYVLLDEMARLHSAKNHDYAQTTAPLSNFKRAAAFGIEPWRGILIRMSDKWARIEQLAGGKQPKNESLRDSLLDNAVYSLLAILLLDEAQPAAVMADICIPVADDNPGQGEPALCQIRHSTTAPEPQYVAVEHGHGYGVTLAAGKMGQ